MTHLSRAIITDSLRYTSRHVWFDLAKGWGGITQYLILFEELQRESDRIIFHPILRPGRLIKIGTPIGTVALSDMSLSHEVISPVNGRILWISPKICVQNYNQPLFRLHFNRMGCINSMTDEDYMSSIYIS